MVGMQSGANYVLDRVQCNGTEKTLDKCRSSGIMIHNCGANEAAGVLCAVSAIGERSAGVHKHIVSLVCVFKIVLLISLNVNLATALTTVGCAMAKTIVVTGRMKLNQNAKVPDTSL